MTATRTTDHAQSSTVEVHVTREPKSFVAGFLLAFLFGPLGLLYSSIGLGIGMTLLSIILSFMTLGLVIFVAWPVCWILSPIAIAIHNGNREKGKQTRSAA